MGLEKAKLTRTHQSSPHSINNNLCMNLSLWYLIQASISAQVYEVQASWLKTMAHQHIYHPIS